MSILCVDIILHIKYQFTRLIQNIITIKRTSIEGECSVLPTQITISKIKYSFLQNRQLPEQRVVIHVRQFVTLICFKPAARTCSYFNSNTNIQLAVSTCCLTRIDGAPVFTRYGRYCLRSGHVVAITIHFNTDRTTTAVPGQRFNLMNH